jgi:hypothetical protein
MLAVVQLENLARVVRLERRIVVRKIGKRVALHVGLHVGVGTGELLDAVRLELKPGYRRDGHDRPDGCCRV